MHNSEMQTVYNKLETSAILWRWIGILQIIFGFWYVTPILLGIWNIKNAKKQQRLVAQYKENPAGMADTIKGWKNGVIGTGVLNFFLGAFIGVVGSIYDFSIISFVEKNETYLRENGA